MLCCFVLLVLMLFAVIVGSIFGSRYGQVEKERHFRGEEGEAAIFRDDKVESSHSSHDSSSEEE